MNEMPENKGAKARFAAPQLQVYGRARDITQAVGSNGNMDASTGSVKTRP